MRARDSQAFCTKVATANLCQSQRFCPTHTDEDTAERLRMLTRDFNLSVSSGEVVWLDGAWYVTHSGLLRIAKSNRCSGIQTEVATDLSDPAFSRWVVKATVYKTPRSKGFVGYGDADPGNVSPLVRGAELRIAETRAVNRALRKAYGIGLCSVEELGAGPTKVGPALVQPMVKNNGNGQPRLRDRLLLLIRQQHLDAEQVKRYAARFCGTASLREASREQVESFVNHLASLAAADRETMLAELSACSKEQPAPAQVPPAQVTQPSSSHGNGRPRRERKRQTHNASGNTEAA